MQTCTQTQTRTQTQTQTLTDLHRLVAEAVKRTQTRTQAQHTHTHTQTLTDLHRLVAKAVERLHLEQRGEIEAEELGNSVPQAGSVVRHGKLEDKTCGCMYYFFSNFSNDSSTK